MDDNRDLYYGYSGGMMDPMMANNMVPNMMPNMAPNNMPNMGTNNLETRLNKIENQIKRLDQRISRLETPYGNTNNNNSEPDNSMYMM